MPFDLSTEIDPAKLTALQAIPRPRVGEIVQIHWAGGALTEYYSFTDWNVVTGYAGLAAHGITTINVRFNKSQFIDITRTSDVSDDKVEFDFWDGDRAIVDLYRDNFGEGTRVTILAWFPEVDLLMDTFWGHLGAPSETDGIRFKISASTGFRSPNLNLPRRTMYQGCQALFGGLVRADGSFQFPTLASLADNDCPYNRHVGGAIGLLNGGVPFTSCPRNSTSACVARLGDSLSYLAFDFQTGQSSVGAGDHKWIATTRGNESIQNKPLRVIAGRRHVRDLDVQAFQSQSGGSNPQAGFAPTLVSVCEGPIVNARNFYVNDQFVKGQNQIVNKGELRQPSIPYPTTVLNYSGTVMARLDAGPYDWRQTKIGDIKVECDVTGMNDVRVYSDATTYVKQYTENRAWWLLHVLTNKRWGYGLDYSRIVVQDWIDLAAWCNNTVTTTDTDGVTPLVITRSTFNADLNERTTQQQITDICLGGRFGLPFNFNGKLRVVPLAHDIGVPSVDDVPTFTDQDGYSGLAGPFPRNIVVADGKSSLKWSVKSDAEIVNQIKITFDDDAYPNQPEHNIIFDDLDQQLKAGIAAGDNTLRVVNKDVAAFGIINYGEAVRWGKLLMNLGEFDGFEKPGIKNNLRVKFTTFAPLVAALKLHPYKVIRVLNSRLQEWEEQPGMPAQWFRVMKMRRLKDQKMEIEAQLFPSNYYGNTETDTYGGSGGPSNPGGDRTSQVSKVRPVIVSRTLDRITVTTELAP